MKNPKFIPFLIILSFCILLAFSTGSRDIISDKYVTVTFDDLPMNSKNFKDSKKWITITNQLIEVIKKNEIPAIGFVNENKLYKNGIIDSLKIEALQKWIDADLELGNHTFSRPDLHHVSLDDFLDDIKKGEYITKFLLDNAGKNLKYFRHPFLHTGKDLDTKFAVEKFLKENGYSVAPVTIDNSEWIFARAYENAVSVKDTILMERIGNEYISYMEKVFIYYEEQSIALFGNEIKQILLLHANLLNSNYLDELAAMMISRNYKFIPLEEALKDSAYLSPDTYTGNGGITWLHRWALTTGKRGDFFKGEPEVAKFVQKTSGITDY